MSTGPAFLRTLLQCGAYLALALAGPRALGQVRVTPASAYVLHGASRTFTATRVDQQAALWVWAIEEGAGGSIDPHTGRFQAPAHVAAPTPFTLRVTDQGDPGMTAEVRVVVSPQRVTVEAISVQEGDCASEVRAWRADAEPPAWAWSVVEPQGGRVGVYQNQPGKTFYLPPRVAEPTRFHLQVRDLAHPEDVAIHEVLVLSTMARLQVANQEHAALRPGQSLEVQATRADGRMAAWDWSVLEPHGGTIVEQQHGLARYTAPRVATPTTFHVRAVSEGRNRATLAIDVKPTIDLTPMIDAKPSLSTHVMSGSVGVIRASYPPEAGVAQPGDWLWNVFDSEVEVVPRGGAGARPDEFSFVAPRVWHPTTFTVQVQDSMRPNDPAEIKIQILPLFAGLEPRTRTVFEELMPKIMGSDWLAPAPMATLLAGTLGPERQGHPKPFHEISCICYVEDDPAMGWLSRHWLVGDKTGLKAVSAHGEITLLSGVGPVTAIAIRPRGSAQGNPNRVAFAVMDGEGTGRIYLRGEDGAPLPLAGCPSSVPVASRLEVGEGAQVGFGPIKGLAWREDGALQAFDHARKFRLRQVAPGGQVTMLNQFDPLRGGTWDPATGEFYFVNSHCVLKFIQFHRGLPVVGSPGPGFRDAAPAGNPSWPFTPCLHHPCGVQILGSYLFIADTGNHALRVFNLQTKKLLTLAGQPSQPATRLGPLGFGSPGLSPHACAALRNPEVFAVNAEGACLVAQDDALVHLDLSAFAVAPQEPLLVMKPSAAMADGEEKSQGGRAAASAAASTSGRKRPKGLDGKPVGAMEAGGETGQGSEVAASAAASSASAAAGDKRRHRD